MWKRALVRLEGTGEHVLCRVHGGESPADKVVSTPGVRNAETTFAWTVICCKCVVGWMRGRY